MTSALIASLAALRSVLSAIVLAVTSLSSAEPRRRPRRRRRRSRAGDSHSRAGSRRRPWRRARAGARSTRAIQTLQASRPLGDDRLGDLGGAVLVVAPGLLGAAGLDHHDGDVAVDRERPATTIWKVESSLLLVGGVRHPLAVLAVGQAHGADGALERQARQHQRGGGAVDGDHVVGVDLVGADDGDDDLGLVAVALGERRAQRPVDQAAGEDGLSDGRPSRRKNEPGILPAA